MAFIAIVSSEAGRIVKYQEFETAPEAQGHVSEHGGFVFDNATDHPIPHLSVDFANQSVTLDPLPTEAEVDAERLSEAKTQLEKRLKLSRSIDREFGDLIRRQINVGFKQYNQLLTLTGQPTVSLGSYTSDLLGQVGDGPISEQQFINFIKNKLS